MGSCLLQCIDRSGAVFADYRAALRRSQVSDEQRFVAGEVLLALTHLYRRTSDERYAEAARRIGDRQLERNRLALALDLPSATDHWFAQALVELSEITSDNAYAELSLSIGSGYLLEQIPASRARFADYRGAYVSPDLPSSNQVACRGEALGAVVRAAELLGRDPSDYWSALLEGFRFVIGQQLTADNSYFVPEQFDVTGAIRMSPVDNHCRIDNNQHAIVSLLPVLDTLD
jgi:hypothetical protein